VKAFSHNGTLKFELVGVVEAPLDRVAELVLAVRPGSPATGQAGGLETATGGSVTGGPRHFTVDYGSHVVLIDVDRDRRAITFQGGWWYRGEYQLLPDPAGTRVVHRVYNVAQRWRWGVALANRFFIGYEATTLAGFKAGLARLAQQLDCQAYVA
jgi:hypothetical protein